MNNDKISENKNVVVRNVLSFEHKYSVDVTAILVFDYVNEVIRGINASASATNAVVDLLQAEEGL